MLKKKDVIHARSNVHFYPTKRVISNGPIFYNSWDTAVLMPKPEWFNTQGQLHVAAKCHKGVGEIGGDIVRESEQHQIPLVTVSNS